MTEKKVKVTIREGYTGHHHQGREIAPGEEIEVWESQAEFLREQGALEEPKGSRRMKKKDESESEDQDAPADEPADETTTEG